MKIYCINTKGLLDRELSINRMYWEEKIIGDKVLVTNNEGHRDWYNVNRFVKLNPTNEDVADDDVKIWGRE